MAESFDAVLLQLRYDTGKVEELRNSNLLSCRQTEKVLNLWKQIKKRNCSIFLLITLLTLLPKELLLSCSSMISPKYSSSSTRAVFLLLHPLTWFFHVSFSHRGMGRTEVREPNLAHTPHEMPQPIKHSTEERRETEALDAKDLGVKCREISHPFQQGVLISATAFLCWTHHITKCYVGQSMHKYHQVVTLSTFHSQQSKHPCSQHKLQHNSFYPEFGDIPPQNTFKYTRTEEQTVDLAVHLSATCFCTILKGGSLQIEHYVHHIQKDISSKVNDEKAERQVFNSYAGNGIQLGSSEQAQTAWSGFSALGEDKSPASPHRVVEHETAERVSTAALFLVLDVETHENYQNYQKHDMEGKGEVCPSSQKQQETGRETGLEMTYSACLKGSCGRSTFARPNSSLPVTYGSGNQFCGNKKTPDPAQFEAICMHPANLCVTDVFWLRKASTELPRSVDGMEHLHDREMLKPQKGPTEVQVSLLQSDAIAATLPGCCSSRSQKHAVLSLRDQKYHASQHTLPAHFQEHHRVLHTLESDDGTVTSETRSDGLWGLVQRSRSAVAVSPCSWRLVAELLHGTHTSGCRTRIATSGKKGVTGCILCPFQFFREVQLLSLIHTGFPFPFAHWQFEQKTLREKLTIQTYSSPGQSSPNKTYSSPGQRWGDICCFQTRWRRLLPDASLTMNQVPPLKQLSTELTGHQHSRHNMQNISENTNVCGGRGKLFQCGNPRSGFKAAQERPDQMQRLFAKHPENMQDSSRSVWLHTYIAILWTDPASTSSCEKAAIKTPVKLLLLFLEKYGITWHRENRTL
ncbi:hypothetical protein Anapl_04182 [Anas platyrhynchos]|uniref:Uncharacterized protein n=1 Tax=Anas platyrhynchos TaxID=8839 RepID=R0JP49_ANAPL|nr:hypothetical protein Anapl_04182 [Anas platyrhynchos]